MENVDREACAQQSPVSGPRKAGGCGSRIENPHFYRFYGGPEFQFPRFGLDPANVGKLMRQATSAVNRDSDTLLEVRIASLYHRHCYPVHGTLFSPQFVVALGCRSGCS